MERRRHPPVELWLFAIGTAAYSLAAFLPIEGYLPANPVGFFAVAAAITLMIAPSRRNYWVLLALGTATFCYPVLIISSWLKITRPSLGEITWLFLTPALLFCLLRSARVRRHAGFEPENVDRATAPAANG